MVMMMMIIKMMKVDVQKDLRDALGDRSLSLSPDS